MSDQQHLRRTSISIDATQRRWGTCPDCGRLSEVLLGRVSLHRRPTGAQFLCSGVGKRHINATGDAS